MFEAEKNKDNKTDNKDYYLSEKGYKVFTEAYHLKRGYCCENMCRHCPYGFTEKFNRKKENRKK
ncbi:MAG: DUF5522 domain-containing protein [Flavobacteriales bacterium]|jgi:hypothetical protein|nr:DUF5522 domain-containing protein [Flavobacteriales bacterium]